MFIFFDDPNDPAIEHLKDLKKVTCIKCTPDFWLKFTSITNPDFMSRLHKSGDYGLELARKAEYDWVIRIDTDELIYTELPLTQILENTCEKIDCLHFQVLETVPDIINTQNYFQDINTFKVCYKRINYRFRISLITLSKLYLYQILYYCRKIMTILMGSNYFRDRTYFNGHIAGKTAFRSSSDVLSTGSHFPISSKSNKLTLEYSNDFYILHYDSCNFEIWNYKWYRRLMGTAKGASFRPDRKKIFSKYKEIIEKKSTTELENYYNKLYLIPEHDKKILLKCGLLKIITLKKEYFEAN